MAHNVLSRQGSAATYIVFFWWGKLTLATQAFVLAFFVALVSIVARGCKVSFTRLSRLPFLHTGTGSSSESSSETSTELSTRSSTGRSRDQLSMS